MTIKKLMTRLSSPFPLWEGLGIALLLFMGSTSLMAKDSDPFGEVDYRKYANNMSLTAFVRMNGQVLDKGIVVAAYCGSELRGKDSPMDDAGYTNILYLDIYGDTKGDKLHFKVFTDGRVIEVNQGLTYTSDDIIGSPEAPYYIDLPSPVVTKPSTEGWATTCLPFDAQVPDGVIVWNVTGIKDSELVITNTTGEILPKNTPVLLQSEGKESYEWLSKVVDAEIPVQQSSILRGTTEPTTVTANSVMTLGHSNETGEIGFWLFTGTTIPANRAYIADFPANSRGFTFPDNTATPVQYIAEPLRQKEHIYDLQGRQLDNYRIQSPGKLSPVKVGRNGQLIIIR